MMKRFKIYFLVIFLIFFQSVFSQTIWDQKNPMPPNKDYIDVCFINGTIGWAVGEEGTIVKTTDGGETWIRQYAHYSEGLSKVFFINETTGWISGRECLKTTDGGITWNCQLKGDNYEFFYQLFFIDESIGWMVGDDFYKTINGGEDWMILDDENSLKIRRLYFINEMEGWAISNYKKVLHTENGGTDWTERADFINFGVLIEISFLDESYGWMVGQEDKIYNTIDGGFSWDTINLNTIYDIIDVKFFDTLNGRAAAVYDCFTTDDGGITWVENSLGSTWGVNTFSFPNPDFAAAVGYEIQFSNNGGQNWQIVENGFDNDMHCAYMINEETIVVAGEEGSIFKTTDGGNTWDQLNSTTNYDIQDIFFIDENNGWLVGNLGTLLKTDNGGQDWINVNINDNYNYHGITFIDELTGWLVTGGGKVFKTTDGGLDWIEVISGGPIALFDVCFVNESIGWVVGNNGTIKKTIDGGLNWEVQASNVEYNLKSISFVDENKGWIAAQKGILYTDNGGIDWQLQFDNNSDPNLYMYSIFFTDSNNGWACGKGGDVFHTKDGGSIWTKQYSGVYQDQLFDIVLLDSQLGCLVGRDGLVLTTDQGTYLGPSLVQQLSDTAICLGDSVTVEINAMGDSLSFLWTKAGVPIENGNSNPLILNPVVESDGGKYNCKVYSDAGFVTSETFIVSIALQVEITSHPSDITASVNDYVVLNQSINGSMPLHYQWQKNGEDLPGANFHTLTFNSIQLSDSGMYRCIISNDCNEVITNLAKLTIIPESSVVETTSASFEVYPNPVSKLLHIQFKNNEEKISSIVIYRSNGDILFENKIEGYIKNQLFTIDTEYFPKGVYLMQIILEQTIFYKKIIKT